LNVSFSLASSQYATCTATLTRLDLTTRKTLREKNKSWRSSQWLCSILQLLPFPSTPTPWTAQPTFFRQHGSSSPHKRTENITVRYILVSVFLHRNRGDQRFWNYW
jgi:hypothetical protein